MVFLARGVLQLPGRGPGVSGASGLFVLLAVFLLFFFFLALRKRNPWVVLPRFSLQVALTAARLALCRSQGFAAFSAGVLGMHVNVLRLTHASCIVCWPAGVLRTRMGPVVVEFV